MKIGVLSDTHRNQNSVERAFSLFKEKGVQVVFHLGDLVEDIWDKNTEYGMELVFVNGNMDFRLDSPKEVIYEANGIRFLLTHGHYHDVRSTLYHLVKAAKENNCQVALYGHTHVPYNNRVDGILVLNPGSASEPRGGSKKSVAIIEIDKNNVNAEVFLI